MYAHTWSKIEFLMRNTVPRDIHHDFVAWVPRILTSAPDLICNVCMDLQSSFVWCHPAGRNLSIICDSFRCVGDGASRDASHSACASVIIGFNRVECKYFLIGLVGVFSNSNSSAWIQEAKAIELAIDWVSFFKTGQAPEFFNLSPFSLPVRGLIENAALPWLSAPPEEG